MGRIIPNHRMRLAVSKFFFYVLTVCVGTFFLLLVEEEHPYDVLFESLSALGTVGLSAGPTATLSPLGKLILCGLMFLGEARTAERGVGAVWEQYAGAGGGGGGFRRCRGTHCRLRSRLHLCPRPPC